MEEELRYFVAYLENIRKASHNTVMSYHSDLTKMIAYLHGQGMDSVSAVRTTHLNSYVLLLEKDGMAAATISRYIASMKGFFEYLFREHMIEEDPAFTLKPPKVEKKQPGILTIQEMEHLLAQTTEDTPKGCRDKAMLELLEPGSYDYLFTAEAKSIPLIHEMARQSGAEKYFIARKGEKVYMPDPIHVEDKSITTAGTQRLYLGSDDAAMIRGKRIVLMDDVISTGGSLLAMEHLVELAGGIVVDRIAALAEGAAAQRKDIKFLAPLPVFNADGTIK